MKCKADFRCVITLIVLMMPLFSTVKSQTQKRSVFWLERSFRDIEALGASECFVIAPMAQIEAHGPHLPVGTDYYIVNEIAKRAAERSGAIVGPPLLIGNCIDFSSWPGYVIVDNSTFISLIKQYCHSMAEQGFNKLVFLVEHGGSNVNGIQMAVEEYHKDHPEMILLITTTGMLLGREGAQFRKPNFHLDTALMLAVKPDLVNMDKLPDNIEIKQRPRTAISFVKGQSLADMAPEALFVLPTGSTKEDGLAILEVVANNLTELIGSY